MDVLSDTVCKVCDLAEIVRQNHKDSEWRSTASQVTADLNAYFQRLNGDQTLWDVQLGLTDDHKLFNSLSSEQQQVATLLRKDCEQSGAHLPEQNRLAIESMRNRIHRLGMMFMETIGNESMEFAAPVSSLSQLPSHILRSLPSAPLDFKGFTVPGAPSVLLSTRHAASVLHLVPNSTVRMAMFFAEHSCCADKNLPILDALLTARHDLASALGFPSFAHYAFQRNVAESPEKMKEWLEDTAQQLMPKANAEMQLLRSIQPSVEPWDQWFLQRRVRATMSKGKPIEPYLSLGNVMAGVSLVFKQVFGIQLTPREPEPGETWAPDVFKIEASKEDGTPLGVVYMDCFPRHPKFPGSAHFVIRSARRHSLTERQLPAVGLVMNLPPSPNSATLLSWQDAKTLFHEWGHSLHSLLSDTEFHHVHGTRCPIDFVETPSTLMELFFKDWRVMRLWARHVTTGEGLPKSIYQNQVKINELFEGTETQHQLLMALFDLELHMGPTAGQTTQLLQSIQERHSVVPYVEGTYPHSRFTHLVGYEAGYYAYQYCKILSSQIWETMFEEDPLNRNAGERLENGLLVFGAAKDPKEQLHDLLGDVTSGSYVRLLNESI